jgi:hypothetical protein
MTAFLFGIEDKKSPMDECARRKYDEKSVSNISTNVIDYPEG